MKSLLVFVGALTAIAFVACGGESESAKKPAAPASNGPAVPSIDARGGPASTAAMGGSATAAPSAAAPAAATGAPAPAPSPVAASEQALEAASKAFADARAANDAPRLFELTKAMMPTTDEMRKVLRVGPETDAFLEQYKAERIRGDANEAAREILKPKEASQTVVKVHSATTEELAAYENGSVAYAEFPGGMKRFAERVAAPGRVWHTIEYLEPGNDAGMKFTAFTVVDGRVFFVVKPWRALPESK
jgi:hypothetical protein